MATILRNKLGRVVVHATANTTWVVAGNNSVSNLALSNEELYGASIRQVWFGSPSGNAAYWTVKRGANTVLVLDSTAWLDFAGVGQSLTIDPSANLTVELTGSTSGYIMLELSKDFPLPANTDYQ